MPGDRALGLVSPDPVSDAALADVQQVASSGQAEPIQTDTGRARHGVDRQP